MERYQVIAAKQFLFTKQCARKLKIPAASSGELGEANALAGIQNNLKNKIKFP